MHSPAARSLAAVDCHGDAAPVARLPQLDIGPRHEALVVEPVQQLAVVLGQADDRGARSRFEVGERRQLPVLRLLEGWVHGPAVRAALRVAEALRHPLDHLVRERVPELVGMDVGLGRGVAEEVGQQALDQPMLADDVFGALASGRRQQSLLLLASFDHAVGLEPLQHLSGRGSRDA